MSKKKTPAKTAKPAASKKPAKAESSLADLAVDTSSPLQFDKHGILTIGSMRIGMIHPSKIDNRRTNPRKMSEAEYNALRSSIDRNGMKSFVVAEELSPGKYGIVDGHHRVQALREAGAPRIPVILMDKGASKDDIDLAMLTFNVTGSPNGDVFMDFLKELSDRMGTEVVAEGVALGKDFLDNMFSTIDEVIKKTQEDAASDEPSHHSGGSFHGTSMKIEVQATAEIKAVLEAVRKHSGSDTDGEAVMAALRYYVDDNGLMKDSSVLEEFP